MTSVEAEFTAFATARTPALYRSAWMLCGDRHTAEDLVQETLAKVYVAWRRSIENPAAYAQTTLVRTFISRRRQRSSSELAYADLPDVPGNDPSSATDLRMQLQEALGSLAPLDRAVVVLRYLEDLPVEEVAARLGLSPGAVKNRSMRALARMREGSLS